MSRSRSRYSRDLSVIANRPRLALRPLPIEISRPIYRPLSQVQDLRLFHPDGRDRRRMTFLSQPVSFGVSNPRRPKLSPHLSFQMPGRVLTCVRRKIRREVMFAKGGAGSRRMKRPRRNDFSSVRC